MPPGQSPAQRRRNHHVPFSMASFCTSTSTVSFDITPAEARRTEQVTPWDDHDFQMLLSAETPSDDDFERLLSEGSIEMPGPQETISSEVSSEELSGHDEQTPVTSKRPRKRQPRNHVHASKRARVRPTEPSRDKERRRLQNYKALLSQTETDCGRDRNPYRRQQQQTLRESNIPSVQKLHHMVQKCSCSAGTACRYILAIQASDSRQNGDNGGQSVL